MCCARSGPHLPDIVPGHHVQRLCLVTLYNKFFFSAPNRLDALFTCSPAHPAMPLAVQGSHFTSFDELPVSHPRILNRRSSCPSIPRSVSACGSVCTLDLGGEDPRVLMDWDDVDMYKSPLFRGLGGVGEEFGDAARRVSPTSTNGRSTPKAKAIDCDDSDSDSLSNYQFDLRGHVRVPEPTKASKGKLSREQSSTLAHLRPPPVPDKSLNRRASRPLLPPRDPLPDLQHFPPSVPPRDTRPIAPQTGTRPLQIDRSKKRTGSSSTSQRVPRADTQHAPPITKPISRATTHVNLREAYRKGSPLVERKVPARGVTPTKPPHHHPHPKTPNQNVTQVIPNYHLTYVLHHADSSHSTANPYPHAISNRSDSS